VANERALQLLKDAGLSGYEAKAYVALIATDAPMNGYEVAKASGMPRSTVYETLGKLVARGAAFEVAGTTESVSYVPLPSDALIGRLRRQTHDTIVGLEAALPQIGSARGARIVHHLRGRAEIIDRAIDVVESARRSLFMSIWPQESEELIEVVGLAVERDVQVFTIAYGNVGDLPGRVYFHTHSTPDVVEAVLQCRLSIVVADNDQAMFGGVTSDAVWGMWSDDRAVALLAAENIRHDIALQLTADRLDAAGLSDFWMHDPDLEAIRHASAAAVLANIAEIGHAADR
jgi:sugar-specific transcriptional regulator TrmB